MFEPLSFLFQTKCLFYTRRLEILLNLRKTKTECKQINLFLHNAVLPFPNFSSEAKHLGNRTEDAYIGKSRVALTNLSLYNDSRFNLIIQRPFFQVPAWLYAQIDIQIQCQQLSSVCLDMRQKCAE